MPSLFMISILGAAAAEDFHARGTSAAAQLAEDYAAFRRQHRHGQSSSHDPVSYATRMSLFQARSAEVAAHNAQPGISWKRGVNKFADHTEAELRGMLGYRRVGRWWERQTPSRAGSFLEVRPAKRAVADSMDWRMRLNSSKSFFRDQGACGSCWAVAAVGALEMHAEALRGPTRPLSFEELVDCVPNPKHCGGDGGCKGATAEMAFEYVQQHGLALADDYKGYASGGDGKCKSASRDKQSAVVEDWVRLPENNLEHLLDAVSAKGPVVVSVDASGWQGYESGVFDGCDKDATVNHAVVVVGYGTDHELNKDYWLIRNSWGEGWGEEGHIRLQRHRADKGDAGYCGTDREPQQGVGCQGGPSELPVCGMCGVLSDSSYPKGVRISSGAQV